MSNWPPPNVATFFLSPGFAARMRALTTRLVRLFPTRAMVAEEAVYDALTDLFLHQKKRGWRPEELHEWLREFQSESRFEAYLFRAAYRRALKGLRQHLELKEQPMVEELPDRASVSEDIEDMNSLVERVAEAVPGDEREVLHLLVEGVPVGEIAHRLGVTERTVYRIRRDLRGILWKVKGGRRQS